MSIYKLPKKPLNKKPLGHVGINKSNPSTKGLTGAFIWGQGERNLVDSSQTTYPQSVISKGHNHKHGPYITRDSDTTQSIDTGLKTGDSYTVLAQVVVTSPPSATTFNQGILGSFTSSGVGLELMLRNSDRQFWWYNHAKAAINLTGDIITYGEPFFVALTYDSTGSKVYFNGVLTDSDGTTSTPPAANTLKIFDRGLEPIAAGFVSNGSNYYTYVYNRALSADEIRSLYKSPYQILKDNKPSFYFTPAAAGGPTYSLTLTSGSYVYTGSAAALAANRKLSLSAGSYTYTGSSVDLAVSRKLDLNAGSYTYTGNDATLKADRKLSLSSGSYTYTGSALTLKAGRKLPIDAGSYTYTGSSVTLTYNAIGGPTYTLTLDVGSYALTGSALGLAANRKLLLSAGSYSYTGQAVNLLAGRALALESGSYTYTGSSKALKANRLISLDAGSYVYTGQSVTLSYSGVVITVIDSYTINFKSDIITATFANDDHIIRFK